MKIIQKSFLFLIGILSVTAINAQDEPIRVDTNLVTVNVSVTDKKGKFVPGLKPEQFEVFDNKTKQKIEHFSASEAPVSYGIIYDMHPATEEKTKAVLESLRQFTKELRQTDDFFLLAFNSRGSLSLDFIPTIDQLEKHLPESREPNALYDAIYAASDKIRASRNLKRTLLIISDSADHQSQHSLKDISKKLKSFDVQVYAVVFDENSRWAYGEITRTGREPSYASGNASGLDRAALQDLTVQSGGTTHFPVSSNSFMLYSIYKQIAGEIGTQYTLGFYPENEDGKWHNLSVRMRDTKDKGLVLNYRQGYENESQKR